MSGPPAFGVASNANRAWFNLLRRIVQGVDKYQTERDLPCSLLKSAGTAEADKARTSRRQNALTGSLPSAWSVDDRLSVHALQLTKINAGARKLRPNNVVKSKESQLEFCPAPLNRA
jgi:hypothetical protein